MRSARTNGSTGFSNLGPAMGSHANDHSRQPLFRHRVKSVRTKLRLGPSGTSRFNLENWEYRY